MALTSHQEIRIRILEAIAPIVRARTEARAAQESPQSLDKATTELLTALFQEAEHLVLAPKDRVPYGSNTV